MKHRSYSGEVTYERGREGKKVNIVDVLSTKE
jgi:hypothetical protein